MIRSKDRSASACSRSPVAASARSSSRRRIVRSEQPAVAIRSSPCYRLPWTRMARSLGQCSGPGGLDGFCSVEQELASELAGDVAGFADSDRSGVGVVPVQVLLGLV
jgi:hypothetical protein